ncbi:hypothetical protein LCGC14_0707590 [marine sediment metagenome]|uniref:Protein translocase subunit SecE n=1 Tax=marine sediment metagenome TaxID=412755 RepID=A0A0F9T1Y0_9ZZZZ
MRLAIYKPGQGRYTRIGTIAGAMLIVSVGAVKLSAKFGTVKAEWANAPAFRFGVPTLIVIASCALLLWLVNRVRAADFLIATEGEMKKVSWSSRREIVGSTKVVIVTTFILAGLLFAVDVVLAVVFAWSGIMGGSGS